MARRDSKVFKTIVPILDESEEYMKDIIRQLKNRGLLDTTDDLTLQMLAITHSTYIKAAREVATNGILIKNSRNSDTMNPAIDVLNKAQTKLENLTLQLGLSPLARKKLTKGEEVEEDSPLEEFLKS